MPGREVELRNPRKPLLPDEQSAVSLHPDRQLAEIEGMAQHSQGVANFLVGPAQAFVKRCATFTLPI